MLGKQYNMIVAKHTYSTRTCKHAHTCAHMTHIHTQPFYGSLEIFTHPHLLWSSVIPNLLPLSITIHGILPVQFTCLIVFSTISKFSLVYLLAWHPQLHSSPNHCLLFTAHAHTIATCFTVVPRLCHLNLVFLSTLYLELYLVA